MFLKIQRKSLSTNSYSDILSLGDEEDCDGAELLADLGVEVEWTKVTAKKKNRPKHVILGDGCRGSSATNSVKLGNSSRGIPAVVSNGSKVTNKKIVDIGTVTQEPKCCLRKVGSGKITIGSGAGESVCPIDMLPNEHLHETSKNGTRYRAAGVQSLVNHGEKHIKFRAGKSIGKLNFQAIPEVKKVGFCSQDCQQRKYHRPR